MADADKQILNRIYSKYYGKRKKKEDDQKRRQEETKSGS